MTILSTENKKFDHCRLSWENNTHTHTHTEIFQLHKKKTKRKTRHLLACKWIKAHNKLTSSFEFFITNQNFSIHQFSLLLQVEQHLKLVYYIWMMNKVVEMYSLMVVEVVMMMNLFHYLYMLLLLKLIMIMVDQEEFVDIVLIDKLIHKHYLEEVLLK